MATNPPKGAGRVGAVKKRKQAFNPKNKRWIKLDTKTKKIINQKSNLKPFKGVRKHKKK